MFKKDTLFINLIKQNNQLKIEQKKFKKDTPIKVSSSTYLVDEDIIPSNISQKLNAIQTSQDSYLSTLLLSDTTKIVPKKSAKVKDCTIIDFDLRHDIVVLDTTLFETKNYFASCGIDFIYSAFHIMKQHIIRHTPKSELIVFIYNSRAYILIVDKHSNIIYNEVIPLLSFDTVKKTHFYENDIEGQKLFDELYYLELNNILQNVLLTFHKQRDDIFVQKISLLLPLKNLSKEQINSLSQELKLKIDDFTVDIDKELDILTKENLGVNSFVKPRAKKVKNDPRYIILVFLFAFLIYGAYYVFKDINFINLAQQLDLIKKEKKVEINLPNHVEANELFAQKIQNIFQTVPQKVMINSMKLDKNSLELEVLVKDDTNLKLFTSSLSGIYKNYKMNKLDNNPEDFSVNLSFENGIDSLDSMKKSIKIEYMSDDIFTIDEIKEHLQILLTQNSEIVFVKQERVDELNKLTFSAKINNSNPQEFFDLIAKLNEELYSINLSFPILMQNNQEDGIEIKFYLDYFQKRD